VVCPFCLESMIISVPPLRASGSGRLVTFMEWVLSDLVTIRGPRVLLLAGVVGAMYI
jgi:hypothetical protein